MTKALPQLKDLKNIRDIKRNRAAITLQSWFRCHNQRKEYLRLQRIRKAKAIRDYEMSLTLKELDQAVQDRQQAQKERILASEELRVAEQERLEIVNKRKEEMQLKKNNVAEVQKAKRGSKSENPPNSVAKQFNTDPSGNHAASTRHDTQSSKGSGGSLNEQKRRDRSGSNLTEKQPNEISRERSESNLPTKNMDPRAQFQSVPNGKLPQISKPLEAGTGKGVSTNQSSTSGQFLLLNALNRRAESTQDTKTDAAKDSKEPNAKRSFPRRNSR